MDQEEAGDLLPGEVNQQRAVHVGTYKHRILIHDKIWQAVRADDVDTMREMYAAGHLEEGGLAAELKVDHLLTRAAMDGLVNMTRCLLELGALPSGYCLADCPSLELFMLMEEYGLDFESDEACILLLEVLEDRELLDWLLDRGVNINYNMNQDYSSNNGEFSGYRDNTCAVLNRAASLGDIDLFDHLVLRGANPRRSLALHSVTDCRDHAKVLPMVHHLVTDYYFDVNDSDDTYGGLRTPSEQDYFRGCPLNFAIGSINMAFIAALLKHGAVVTADTWEEVAYRAEDGENTIPIVRLFLQVDSNATADLVCEAVGLDQETRQVRLRRSSNPKYDKNKRITMEEIKEVLLDDQDIE